VRRASFALLLLVAACVPAPVRHALPARPRIVALMPSFTEDLVRIGAAAQIVGVSNATDDIVAVRSVPRVATFSSVDVERIVSLRPDVIVAIPAQMRYLSSLDGTGIDVVVLPDDTYDEIFTNLQRLGALSGHVRAANAEIASLRAQAARIVRSEPRGPMPSVFVVLGAQPIWTIGNGSYIATLVAMAGGRNTAGLRVAYGEYSAEALLRLQPDALVSDPSTQLMSMLGREPWRSLVAVQRHHVFIMPNAALLERPGPRYVEGLAWLVKQFRAMQPRAARGRS
jgi:iron complex transport system substrate-binding protein